MTLFEQNYNDKHFKYSIAKSVIRLVACFIFIVVLACIACDIEMSLKTFAFWSLLFPLGFAIAEILGIMEENI
jgi:hypothetical protein